MSQRSQQTSAKNSQKDSLDLPITFLHCPHKGHENLELKFVSKKEFPNVSHLYCSSCLSDPTKAPSVDKQQIISLVEIFKETVAKSNQYMAQLDPVMANIQRRQEENTKKDFKTMFQSVITKRETFRQTIADFKMDLAKLCQRYEAYFEKQLETMFYKSFFAIETRLSSFKNTFEVLRLRINSYSQELSRSFNSGQDAAQYCQNISTVLKDLEGLKSNSLVKMMNKAIHNLPSNGPIIENFNANSAIEDDIEDTFNQAFDLLCEKIECLEKGLEPKPKIPKEKSLKPIEAAKEDSKEGEKGNTQGVGGQAKPPQQIWADPADESIEIFEREIAKFYQGDLIKRLSGAYDKEEEDKKENEEVKDEDVGVVDSEGGAENKENIKQEVKEDGEERKMDKSVKDNKEVIREKMNEYMHPAGTESDGSYVSDDEEDEEEEEEEEGEEEGTIQREVIYQLKNSVQPEIFRKLFKSRKFLRKSDRHLRLGLVKLSQTIVDDKKPKSKETIKEAKEVKEIRDKEETPNNKDNTAVPAITNTTEAQKQPVKEQPKETNKVAVKEKEQAPKKEKKRELAKKASEVHRDPLMDFLAQLEKEIPNPEVFEKLQKLVKKVKVTGDKNKRLTAQSILAIQDFVGEFLRENHVNNVFEYRKKRRQFNDNEEAMKYNYVCRDFFIKYYSHYKKVKSMFLEELGISKQGFNNDYKYWLERGHTYLAWSRFKSKLQKASKTEATKIINSGDLKAILTQLLYFLKDPLGEFKDDIVKTKKKERYLLVELLLARVYDRAFFSFQLEEEDILGSLNVCFGPPGKEAHQIYEEFESIIANVMYPEMKVQVNYEDILEGNGN